LSKGDVFDSLQTLAAIADDPDFMWSDPKAHGGPEERRAAMARGYISGDPTFCRAYEETGPILVQQVGAYSLRLPPAATVQTLNNGALRVTTSTEPEFTTDLTAVANLEGSDTAAALTAYLPTYFAGSGYSLVGSVEPFEALPGDLLAATQRYQQTLESGPVHGALLLVTRGAGPAMVIDVYENGPAPADDQDWQRLGDFAFSALWGIG
jgi:hypothetical protein